MNKSPFQTRLSKDASTRSQKVLQPPVSALNVVSENTADEEDPVINAAQYSATKAKKEPIVKKIQTHVQQIMAAGFAKQKPRRQPTAEEVRQVKRKEQPDRQQQREDEERFILQTQMQRKANFHAVQDPSIDWNQPYPEEQRH